ncbi:MAG: RNA-binding cell elongation regulator Jag/EloR [Anaerolineaceae bacterium]|jgi:spoIIIJ-associated protein
MNQRLTLEVIAPTVEEAIEKGLEELGLVRDEVDVEVLDEGKLNLFRFASRQARIKLIVKHSVMKGQNPEITPDANEEELSDSDDDELFEDDFDLQSEFESTSFDESDEEASILFAVNKILDLMGTEAEVSIQKRTSEDDQRTFYNVDIQGDDLSYLIGRRSETLNAIQYMVSLIVSHQYNRWVPIQIDIQNYRKRRQTELQKLARRMADQVVATGRRQTLESMPANERRIIHIELRKRDDVYTESIGEEPYRKVYIYPAE